MRLHRTTTVCDDMLAHECCMTVRMSPLHNRHLSMHIATAIRVHMDADNNRPSHQQMHRNRNPSRISQHLSDMNHSHRINPLASMSVAANE